MNQETPPNCLLILGCGYVGKKLARYCLDRGIQVKATARNQARVNALQGLGIDAVCQEDPSQLNPGWLAGCDALLDSIPLSYNHAKQPFQTQSRWVTALINIMPDLAWAGYLSSTAVYADSEGDWIDESCTGFSTAARGKARLKAEQAWLQSEANCKVFRLAGIYGNERNILSKLQAGSYKTIHWDTPHYSNRIHVDDIVATLIAAMHKPEAGRILNVTDDAPCSHEEYASTLASFINAPPPLLIPEKDASTELSPAYLSFFQDNKRISNRKLHQELLPTLKYPGFRDAMPFLKI